MNTTPEWLAELHELLELVHEDRIGEAERQRLNELLASGQEQRDYYVTYMDVHSFLAWNGVQGSLESRRKWAVGQWQQTAMDDAPIAGVSLLGSPPTPLVAANSSQPSPFANVFSGAFPTTLGHLLSGWPMAYLIAIVMTAIGLLVCAHTYISSPTQIVGPLRSETERHTTPAGGNERRVIGRITGMVDCVWEHSDQKAPKSEIRNLRYPVRLGDRLNIRSGLLEITYDTGASVILQGPVTYEVESATGGYLAVGKLTARLEKKAKSISLSPLFAVRTPTAIVTDLGTEFGVEVDKKGSTKSHVFRGLIEVQPIGGSNRPAGKAIRLRERESVQVDQFAGVATASRDAVDPATFVGVEQFAKLADQNRLKTRRRWQAYSDQLRKDPTLLAYYTFEPVEGNNTTLQNLSPVGSVLNGQIQGGEWVHGRWPGKWALHFHGAGSNDKVVLPQQERFNFTKPFSIAVWFRVQQFRERSTSLLLIAKGRRFTWRSADGLERVKWPNDRHHRR